MLDFGGGSGLLCRLLRDIGIDAWSCDALRSGEYALKFQVDPAAIAPGTFDVVTAFEVLEHLENPHQQLDDLFKLRPNVLVISTDPYLPGYDASWWYLTPETGQHVFFYSLPALQMIAKRFGYELLSSGRWHIFALRPISGFTRKLAAWLLTGKALSFSPNRHRGAAKPNSYRPGSSGQRATSMKG